MPKKKKKEIKARPKKDKDEKQNQKEIGECSKKRVVAGVAVTKSLLL